MHSRLFDLDNAIFLPTNTECATTKMFTFRLLPQLCMTTNVHDVPDQRIPTLFSLAIRQYRRKGRGGQDSAMLNVFVAIAK